MSYKEDKVDAKLDYWVSRLCILNKDKFEKVRIKIVENLNWVVEKLSNRLGISAKHISKVKLGYRYFVRIPLTTSFNHMIVNNEIPHIVLLVHPFDSSRPFIELQFKGHPYLPLHWAIARVILEGIITPKVYKKVFGELVTNGLDLRIDVDEKLDDFFFDCLKTRSSAIFTKDGQLQTMYFNKKKSPFHVGIYSRDGKKESKHLPKDHYFDTRIELRQRGLNLPIREVLKKVELVKEFRRFKVYDMKQLEQCEYINYYFVLACKAIGLKPCIEGLNKSEKRKVKHELKRYEILIVNEKLVERQVMQYMSDASIIDPLNTQFDEHLKKISLQVEQTYFQ